MVRTERSSLHDANNAKSMNCINADEGLEPRLPASNSTIKGFIKEWANREHEKQWNEATEYRHILTSHISTTKNAS